MEPRWAKSLPLTLIERVASEHFLDPQFVAAVVQVESAGNSNACRFEPLFKYLTEDYASLAKRLRCTVETMEVMQKTSWGLMQVMGAVGYESGLMDEIKASHRWPTAMLIPAIGLKYGCIHLKLKLDKYGPDPMDVYAAYNAGSVRKRSDGKYVNYKNVDHFERYYREISDNG